MDVTCSHCNTEYEFDDALVSGAGTSVRCTQCGHRFKVRRPEGSGAPEVWIVRTVDGQTLEFRALRDLKTAISARAIGRDDVLSRGAGRPRRLTSIAELEPFFAALEPKPKAKSDGPRARVHTPSGLGPANPRGSYFDLAAFVPPREGSPAVNVPPPTPAGAARKTNPFDEEEVTRSRQLTRELHQLGEQAPLSIEPRTEPDPKRFPDSTGPRTVQATEREAPRSAASLATTLLFGTPNDVAKGDHLPSFEEPTGLPAESPGEHRKTTLIGLKAEPRRGLEVAAAAERERAEAASAVTGAKVGSGIEAVADGGAAVRRSEPRKALKSDPLPPLPPGPAYAGAAAGLGKSLTSSPPKTATPLPPLAVRTPSAPPPPARLPPPKAPPRHEAKPEPELLPPEVEPTSARPNVVPPPPAVERVGKAHDTSPSVEASTEEASRSDGARGRGRSSSSPLNPASEVRYSIVDDLADSRRESSIASRRSSSSMRLIVGLLIGGGLVFAGVVAFNKYLSKPEDAAAAKAPDASALLVECERALAEGDLVTAGERAASARKVAEADPRVAKLSAKVAIAKAELVWLELLVLPRDDAGRSVVVRRYQTEVEEATLFTDRAALLAPGDVEVARLVMDQKRLVGDVGAALRLRPSLEPIGGEPETDLALGALEMLSADVSSWTTILDRLERATAGEKQVGRARALFVYALVRARDAKRARAQLDELAKLARPHPVEAALRRFVERVERGEKINFRLADLPSPDAKVPSVDVAGPLKAADEALAKRDTKKAEGLYQQVLSADEHNADALVGLAQIAKQNGNAKQATSYLERAVEKHPEHARALLALADARWDASDSASAKSLYKRALDAGLTGAGADRAKQRTSATSATGTAEPAPTATVDPTPTATTPTTTSGGVEPPPFGQDPPPFGQDPPPPPAPKPPDTSQPPGAPL